MCIGKLSGQYPISLHNPSIHPPSALPEKNSFKAPDGSDFLRGLEEKNHHSPFFGIPVLKRLS
jgi:hypothetical protein